MLTLRPSSARGHFNHGWLDTYHTFSFGEYHDPAHVHFRRLRVINEDVVAPGQGFGMHPHRDMEIITWVLSGVLAHKDSLGNGESLRQGELQRMTAGSGILHSEFNPSDTEPVHLLQIWIMPEKKGLQPSYEQKRIDPEKIEGRLGVIASFDGRDGSIGMNADAIVYAGRLGQGKQATVELRKDSGGWVQVARGAVVVNGTRMIAGDGAAIEGEQSITIAADGGAEKAEVIVFDLA